MRHDRSRGGSISLAPCRSYLSFVSYFLRSSASVVNPRPVRTRIMYDICFMIHNTWHCVYTHMVYDVMCALIWFMLYGIWRAVCTLMIYGICYMTLCVHLYGVWYIVKHAPCYICMCVCTHTYMYSCLHAYMYVCMYVCMYVRMYVYVYVCMFVCIYVCMFVCLYVSANQGRGKAHDAPWSIKRG